MDLKEKLQKSIVYLSNILLKRNFDVNLINFEKFTDIIIFVFLIDDIFDKNNHTKFEEVNKITNDLKAKLIGYNQTIKAIDKHIKYRYKEYNKTNLYNLANYLEVTGVTIGTEIFSAFLRDTFQIQEHKQISKLISQYNRETNTILRLSNDLLDFVQDKKRMEREEEQIKTSKFIHSPTLINILIQYKYICHKIKYKFQIIFRKELILINILESVFDWAYYEMYISKNSGR